MPDYSMTAALWLRILLKELCEIRPSDIVWYNGRINEFSHGALLGLDKAPPPGLSLIWLTEQQTLDAMLEAGELDAAFGFLPAAVSDVSDFTAINRYAGTPVIDNPRLEKLFADGGRQIILEYFQKTGVLPTNHMVALKNKILQDHKWVALELYKAFQGAKEVAYERARRLRSTYLLFEGNDYNDQSKTIGEDPYPLGVKANRRMLEILFQSSHEEGLTKKLWRLEDIFYPTTLDT